MTCTVEQFIAAVAADLNYTEQPPGSNRNKFAAIAGHQNGAPWCATMLVAKAKQGGLWVPDTAWTPGMADGFRARGAFHKTPMVGDFAFCDFPDDVYRIQHVEVVERVIDATHVQNIGGNTSASHSGSQTNGGGVFRRTRSASVIVGYGRPPYSVAQEADVALDHKVLDKNGDATLWFVFTDPVTGLATGGCYRIPTQAKADQQIALERQRLEAAGRPHALSDVRQTWAGSKLDKITAHNLGDL